MEKARVQKIIAESGYCSRRNAEELISQGKVTVNGKLVEIGNSALYSDEIKVDGQLITKKKKVYIMLNKPVKYITTNSDLYDRKKAVDLIDIDQRVFPVGRLDRDATGLLLFTNDGEWANELMHPRYEKEKEYEVFIDGFINKEIAAEMNKGFKLKDGWIKPRVIVVRKNHCKIIVSEGRNKIVKRIFNHFDIRVKLLKRVRMGKYRLGNLKPGEWKYIEK